MKKILPIMVLIICGFLSISNVYAGCEYGVPSPQIYTNGTWKKDGTFNVNTSLDSCYGSNTAVYFSDGSYLPMGRFNINAQLWEEDPPGNADEQIKNYQGYNSGYSLITWQYLNTVNSGKVDSTGDQTCELYMKFQIATIDPSPFTIMDTNLFKYTMCI